jgi:hypothetical protein
MDNPLGGNSECGVGIPVVRKGGQPHGERPSTTSFPHSLVDGQLRPENVPRVRGAASPGGHYIARRISNAETSKVDYCTDPTVVDKEVACLEVAVEPDVHSVPRGSVLILPGCHRRSKLSEELKR